MKEKELINKVILNISSIIIGKDREVKNLLKAIISNGHVLIEDVPGVGKTTLVKSLAKSLDLTFGRIQFTPDVLPSDVTGVSIYNQREMDFEFKKGPVFSNILLGDEINRTSPKTQSSLLEVMEEYQVTEGNTTYKLERPFFVLATQNPIEYHGTYELPEAQLDRFMIKINLGYPSIEDEISILEIYKDKNPLENATSVLSKEELIWVQESCRKVNVHKSIREYIASIAYETRNNEYLSIGISTRASLSLLKISQATALMEGRDYVIPDDVKNNLNLVLEHRLVLSPLAKAGKYSKDKVLRHILEKVKIPVVSDHG
ncbi:AAA family ATPase [Clostridium hydrogeniformans]|uniref:AAA family ATPase n=1 Tax=Clostridium hydrogeniformans TaxID=349933 RepID=UPI000484D38A|nr:MoxR family ATPase [Clostridium hydrogeniformans]